jgi:hypothetical protein
VTLARTARRFTPEDRAASTWQYLPFDIPPGCGGFTVSTTVSDPAAVVDLGCTGPHGWRGWSGGARREFTVTDDDATPGYLPGVPAGSWSVVLGLHRVPAAGVDVTVNVDTGPRPLPAAPSPPAMPARPPRPDLPALDGMRFLACDFHCHTVHSDGADTIDAVAALGVAAGLDALAVTDHNTTSHHPQLAASGARYGISLLPGQEVTTWRGHANAFGDIGWIDFREPADRWITESADRGGLLSVNHPVSGDCAWRWPLTGRPPLLETWHSSWFDRTWGAPLAYRQAFAPGSVPIGGADYHRAGSDAQPGYPTTWVLARSADTVDVLEGLAAGRTAISAGPGAPVLVRAGEEFLAIGADGLLLADSQGRRTVLRGDRVLVPAAPGLHWLEDGATGVQAICA